MTWTVIITLLIVGLLLILLEIFVLPGFIAGVLGGLAVIVGIFQAYKTFGNQAGHITLVAVIIASVLMLILLFRSGTWKRLALHDAIDSKVNVINEDIINQGVEGIAATRLNPAGKGLFGDDVIEVHSMSGIVEKDTEIVVMKVSGYKVFVKPKNEI